MGSENKKFKRDITGAPGEAKLSKIYRHPFRHSFDWPKFVLKTSAS